MPAVVEQTNHERVEEILASGTGTLDFAVSGEESYYTRRGTENADWAVEDVASVENVEEDRILLHPQGEYFVCEIAADGEEHNQGPVRCYCP